MANPFTIQGSFAAKCVAVYDGDTITAQLKFRQETPETFKVRLLHINAPETKVRKTIANREEVKKAGLAARDYLRGLILGENITLECEGFDSFGRVLATLTHKGENINQLMITAGHAVQWKK